MSAGAAEAGGRTQIRTVVVARRTALAETVIGLDLRAVGGGALPPWPLGGHLEIVLANGLTRSYSLVGDPRGGPVWSIAVRLDPNSRGGSAWIAAHAQPGATLTVRGPRTSLGFIPAAGYRFVAGEMGIAPILPMVRRVATTRVPWRLTYLGTDRCSMPFVDQVDALAGRVEVVAADGGAPVELGDVLADPGAGEHVYCCGPARVVGAVEAAAQHWPDGSVHVECFDADLRAAGTPEQEPAGRPADERSFEVVFERSGLRFTVPPGESILSIARRAGLNPVASCTAGVCGMCETAVLSGAPDHRDSLLTEAERARGGTMMICVSRSRRGRLVLDL